MNKDDAPTVAAVIVTHNRKKLLGRCLDAVRTQTRQPDVIIVINNGSTDGTAEWLDTQQDLLVIHQANEGGAGGFHTGIKAGFEKGYDWIWCMDDDGMPEALCLQELLDATEKHDLMVAAPAVIDICNTDLLAFGLVVDSQRVLTVQESSRWGIIEGTANLFNGVLLQRDVVTNVGLPNRLLFIKGDEVDYLQRIIRAGCELGTVTKAKFYHPSDMDAQHALLGGRFIATYFASPFKDYFTYRNRAYLNVVYFGLRGFAKDLLRYVVFFLFVRRFDMKGLLFWLKATVDGLLSDLERDIQNPQNKGLGSNRGIAVS